MQIEEWIYFYFRLAPYLLDPEPVELAVGKGGYGDNKSRNIGPDGVGGKWSGESSRNAGFRADDQVKITPIFMYIEWRSVKIDCSLQLKNIFAFI